MPVYIKNPIGMSYSYNTMVHFFLNVYTYFRSQSSFKDDLKVTTQPATKHNVPT